jgi:hypothetical protein
MYNVNDVDAYYVDYTDELNESDTFVSTIHSFEQLVSKRRERRHSTAFGHHSTDVMACFVSSGKLTPEVY